MGFDLSPQQQEETGRFSSRYLPDAMNNNLGHNPQNLVDFDAQKDATLRADRFIKDNGLNQHGVSIRGGEKWTGVFNPSREEGSHDYHLATAEQRTDIARYAMQEANNLQGERVMLQSMGINPEDVTGKNGRDGYGHSFQHMLMDHPELRPTDAEIARFEELTSFDKNGDFGNTDHSAEATKSRLHVPEHNREAFEQFRTDYLADRGMEYDPLSRTATEQQAPSRDFSQDFGGGMADAFVAEHNAKQAAREAAPSTRGSFGTNLSQDGPDFA